MKKLLSLALLFVNINSFAQFVNDDIRAKGKLAMPSGCGDPAPIFIKQGAIYFDTCNDQFFVYNPALMMWRPVVNCAQLAAILPSVPSIATLEDYADASEAVVVSDTLTGDVFTYDASLSTFDNGTTMPATGKGVGGWRRVIKDNVIHVKWFGAVADGTDETTKWQTAINTAILLKKNVTCERKAYKANIEITGQVDIDFNYGGLIPVKNKPTIYINRGNAQIVLRNLVSNLSTVSRDSTHADGIYVDGVNGTEDNTTLTNIQMTGGPGYGLYLIGSGTGGHTVQRVRVRDSKFVQFVYAGVREEGVVLECEFENVFTNQSGAGGALPVVSDQLNHPASPSREFRRGSWEILPWYSADNVCNQSLSVNRTNIKGCNIVPQDTTLASRRIAGLYVSGGTNISVEGTNFEFSHPAIWAAREDGETDGNYAVFANTFVVSKSTIRISSGDKALIWPMVQNDGYRNFTVEHTTFKGVGGTPIYAAVLNNWNGTNNTNNGPCDYARGNRFVGLTLVDTAAYKGRYIKYTANCYATESAIAGATSRWEIPLQSVDNRVGLSNSSHKVDAIFSDNAAYQFSPGQIITISPLIEINGSVIVRNNSDDGNGGGVKLPGRILLTDGIDYTLNSNTQTIVLQWNDADSAWHEVGKNFKSIPSYNIYGTLSDMHQSPLVGGVYKVSSTTINVPTGWGTATGIAQIVNTSSDNIFAASVSGTNETIILFRNNTNRVYYQNYIGSTNTWSAWDSIGKPADKTAVNPIVWNAATQQMSFDTSTLGFHTQGYYDVRYLSTLPLTNFVSGSNVTTTGTTAIDIPGLSVPVAANKKYHIEAFMYTGCDNSGGLGFAWTGPSGTTMLIGEVDGTGGTGTTDIVRRMATAQSTLTAGMNTVASTSGIVRFDAVITTSATPGTFQLQFASITSTQTSTIFINSSIIRTEVQ